MRTNARSLSVLASALLLATSAAIVPGCAKPESPPPPKFQACTGPATTVTVVVESDGKTSNKEAYVCEGRDTVEWFPADPDTYVSEDLQWKEGSPFEHAPKHETHGTRKVLKSEKPKRGTAGKGYPYDAWLVLKDGTKKQVDPIIRIMP